MVGEPAEQHSAEGAANPFTAPESEREPLLVRLTRLPGPLVLFFGLLGLGFPGMLLDPTMPAEMRNDPGMIANGILYGVPSSIAAIVCGVQNLRRGRSGVKGRGFHIAGILLGLIGIIGGVLAVLYRFWD